ncbi:uncharacterized protein LOC144422933 [Styela clava]
MAVSITPQMRVDQYPDEFIVRRGELWCKWCDRQMNHKRKDLMTDHMEARIHQENRVARGAKMSYDINSRKAAEKRRHRRQKKMKSKIKQMSKSIYSQSTGAEDSSSEESDSDLRKLFEESDSDSTTSFEGFDSQPIGFSKAIRTNKNASSLSETAEDDDSRRSGRSRKRPARLDDSLANEEIAKIGKIADQAAFVSSMAKRRKTTDEYSSPSSSDLSPTRIRSMPIKKQISFSARQSDSTSPTTSPTSGLLKMKFSRASGSVSEKYTVKPDKTLKVSKADGSKGLKLKFVWKKKQHSSQSEDMNFQGTDNDSVIDSLDGEPAGYQEMLKGIEDSKEEVKMTSMDAEVVEEEIVEMREEEVVTEEDLIPVETLINDDQENAPLVEEQQRVDNKWKAPKLNEQRLQKTPLKSVTKSKPKSNKPKVISKQQEKKKKTTGYMMWANQMRPKVSRQYPGLEFGDVSKKLGDLWKRMPDKEKQMWKFRNAKLEKQSQQSQMRTIKKTGGKMIETGPRKKMIETGPKKKLSPLKHHMTASSPPVKNPVAAMNAELERLPPPTTEPLDSAAYLSLLGESFIKLSAKTKKVESKVVIQGAESILLDSLVCALTPLLSLTLQIPELSGALDQTIMANTFSNVAHIMPGL